MSNALCALGCDASYEHASEASTLLAQWLDAVHAAVLSHQRARSNADPYSSLAARAKLFAAKFAKGRESSAWLTNGIRPNLS